jgi:hypothetical protein
MLPLKTADFIENAEVPLEVILPVDNTDELQRHFGDYTPEIL